MLYKTILQKLKVLNTALILRDMDSDIAFWDRKIKDYSYHLNSKKFFFIYIKFTIQLIWHTINAEFDFSK